MLDSSLWGYIQTECYEFWEWAKCGDGSVSAIPTMLWGTGAAALAHRVLTSVFRRFLFRRVPPWEIMLQYLLFIWMVIYSLHFWTVLVKYIKTVIEFCFNIDEVVLSEEDIESQKMIEQWLIWVCGIAPLAIFVHTRPRPDVPPLMIWITTSPWQRREMGPYGYYLNRPLSSLQSSTNVSLREKTLTLRRAFSDSKIVINEPTKKKRNSKSV